MSRGSLNAVMAGDYAAADSYRTGGSSPGSEGPAIRCGMGEPSNDFGSPAATQVIPSWRSTWRRTGREGSGRAPTT